MRHITSSQAATPARLAAARRLPARRWLGPRWLGVGRPAWRCSVLSRLFPWRHSTALQLSASPGAVGYRTTDYRRTGRATSAYRVRGRSGTREYYSDADVQSVEVISVVPSRRLRVQGSRPGGHPALRPLRQRAPSGGSRPSRVRPGRGRGPRGSAAPAALTHLKYHGLSAASRVQVQCAQAEVLVLSPSGALGIGRTQVRSVP